ncbi:hypothetical protein F4859DRAFT_526025 [Xylaria cf. heliscus]|nr:hypothetical protein F4859DRAFT_526025 [Xylaria cf. heliscus]
MERPGTREEAEAHIDEIRRARGIDTSSYLIDTLETTLETIAHGLYQQPTRFLLELLQNADDCSYDNPTPTMDIMYWNDRLRVDYNELGFTRSDVDAICKVSTTKMKSTDKTGEKGIGFKSVFKVANVVWVRSNNYSFQFDATRKLGMITPQWADFPFSARPGYTSILLELRGDCKLEELEKEMKSMSCKPLLFLRRLRQINIAINAQEGETWKTTLSRKDGPHFSGSRLTTTTLSQDGKDWVYWMYQHRVKPLHSEPKRTHCVESVVTLAFPVCITKKSKTESLGVVAEPVIEEQDVHATLPFLINADFLLVANREDIVSSSDWNTALRDSIIGAFQGAIGQLNTGDLRYTWPRYVPALHFLHFFQDVGNGMKNMLLNGEFLESMNRTPVTARSARYVPKSMRGWDNLPLSLGPKTKSKYLSLQYADSDWSCLQQFGVRMLSETEFLKDLEIIITANAEQAERKSEKWHAQVAKVLTRFYQDDVQHKRVIKDLPLIPLKDGRWASGSMGTIFFPESDGPPIPADIGVSFVDVGAMEDVHRKLLFQTLGVQALSVQKIQGLVIEALSSPEVSKIPHRDVLIAHTVFLFRTKWSFSAIRPSFWVVSEGSYYLPASQVYLDTTRNHSFGKHFEDFRQRFPFLNPEYHQAVEPAEKEHWLIWLQEQLGVRNTSELVPRLQELTVEECTAVNPPSQTVLISHAVFLFRTKWDSNRSSGKFWLRTDTETYVRAREVYYDVKELHCRQYFKRFRQDFPFLHPEYCQAVKTDELASWLSWLRKSLGVWDVPRLVNDSDPSNFSEDFQCIMKTWPSREFLILLREEWDRYAAYFGQQAKNDGGNPKHEPSTASAELRKKLRSAMVSCSDGSSRPLCDTFTISVFPKIKDHTVHSSQLLLDIPEPDSVGWHFLESFGVTIKDNVKIYLKYLDLERIRGPNASKSFVAWLYGKIQEKADEGPEVVKEAFTTNCIFIPSSRASREPIWVKENECVWDGARLLQKFHVLKRLYSQYERLFTKFLTHTHMDLEVLIAELESVTASTPLNSIIELFKEISTRHVSRLSKSQANRLRSSKIFPIDEGNAKSDFDDLCSGLDDSEWYIADSPQYRNSFRGVVSLLSFSPWDILTMMPLIKVLDFESRLLSKRAVPKMRISGNVQRDPEQTELFRAKSKFIAGMMPESLVRRKEILKALNTMEVFLAEEVLVEWTMTSTDSRLAGLKIKSQNYDEGGQAAVLPPTKERGIQLFLSLGSRSYLPFEIATQLADICGIGEQADLVYFVFSQPSLSYIEQYLDQRDTSKTSNGNLDDEIDKPDDFDPSAAGEDDVVVESTVIHLENDTVNHQEFAAFSRHDESPQLRTTTAESAQPGVVLNNVGTNGYPLTPLADEQEVLRPGYASLGDQFGNPVAGLRQNQAKSTSSAVVKTEFHPFPVVAQPRIVGKPHVTFISDPEELPREDFSEDAPGGNVFPGRAHISKSGSCNIMVATSPDARSDPDVAFAGELLVVQVSKLLEQHLGTAYHPEQHWTSRLRTRADHTSLPQYHNPTATFTLEEVPAVTNFLLRSCLQEAMLWWLSCPVYHIQVQTTIGGQDSPFIMSAAVLERARMYSLPGPWPELPDDVFILVRVADLDTRPTAFFYIDPYRMYASGQMRMRPERDFFAVEIRQPKPQIALGDFGYNESAALLYGWTALLGKLNRSLASGMLKSSYDMKYTYRPLTHQNIRLLELFPGDTLDELKGKLYHTPFYRTLRYQAISYAWGFGIKPFVLKTPEGVVGITASLCFGLRRLRQKDRSILVWADAICIDQSNAEEKSRQVRLMPKIFQTAMQVAVWTGPEANGSNGAIRCLRRMARSAEAKYPQQLAILEESAVWDSINSFFKRPWFQRAWIAQELVLASQVIVMCGDKSAQWDDIYAAARICDQRSRKSSIDAMKHIGKNVSAVLSLGDLRLSYHKEEDDGRRLLTLFQRFHHTKATLQRDKLFALLGLANDAQEPQFNPDYAAPLQDIVQRYAGVFVRRGSAMELLYHAEPSSSRFPSWIPDWITNTPKQTISTWPSTPLGFTACTSSASDARLSPDDSSVLIVKGYMFDLVKAVSNTSYEKAGCLAYLKELSDMVIKCPSYPTGESLEDLKWKIPIGGLVETTSVTGEQVDFRRAYQALTEYLELEEQHQDWKTEVMQIRALGKIKHFLFRPDELRKLLWPYLRTALEFAERFVDASVCKTQQGYFGIVPGRASPGDMVAMVCGSAVPFLIRENKERPGHYIHLGESYIHGIMHGIPTVATSWIVEEDIKLV